MQLTAPGHFARLGFADTVNCNGNNVYPCGGDSSSRFCPSSSAVSIRDVCAVFACPLSLACACSSCDFPCAQVLGTPRVFVFLRDPRPSEVKDTHGVATSHILVLFTGSNISAGSLSPFLKLWTKTNLNLFTTCVACLLRLCGRLPAILCARKAMDRIKLNLNPRFTFVRIEPLLYVSLA